MLAKRFLLVCVSCLAPSAAVGAELEPRTVAAYERYIDRLEQDFAGGDADLTFEHISREARARLRRGEVLGSPGHEDGILDVPGGLIHHWRGAIFVPDATLAKVLAVAQDYGSYPGVYDWVIRSRLLRHVSEREPRRDRFWMFLRIERRAGVVTSTLDMWTSVEYHYPREAVSKAMSNADCIRQVEDAGGPDETRLPVGRGSGYLWRANTYTTYVERDGGVYIDLQTVGLSRRFPPLLGWLIEPIARRLGRGSAAGSLEHLREAVVRLDATGVPPPKTDRSRPLIGWCGEPAEPPGSPAAGDASPDE